MISLSIESVSLDEETKRFLKTSIDKSKSYYGFRNRLAHGVPRVNVTDLNNPVFEWHPGRDSISLDPITKPRIDICANNFGDLANLLMSALFLEYENQNSHETKYLQELERQVFLLPNPPDQAESSKSQLNKLKQREQKPSTKKPKR